jgi:hypothetical protein
MEPNNKQKKGTDAKPDAQVNVQSAPPVAALQLRAINIIYEISKERGTTILIPGSMLDILNLSVTSVALSLATTELPDPELVPHQLAAAG